MMLVNTTFCIDSSVEQEWLQWATGTYAHEARTASLESVLVARILAPSEEGTVNYAVQARGTEDAVEAWLDAGQAHLLASAGARWGKRVLHFTTLMEVVAQ